MICRNCATNFFFFFYEASALAWCYTTNVGKGTINKPFGNGLFHLFMVTWGDGWITIVLPTLQQFILLGLHSICIAGPRNEADEMQDFASIGSCQALNKTVFYESTVSHPEDVIYNKFV